ncbi:MAG: hypothetical protein R3Y54_03100 [Eubacteriales bacterium]
MKKIFKFVFVFSSACAFIGSIYYYLFKSGESKNSQEESDYDDLDHFDEESYPNRSYVSLQPSSEEDYLDDGDGELLNEEDIEPYDLYEDELADDLEGTEELTEVVEEESPYRINDSILQNMDNSSETEETFTEDYL